MKSVVPKTIQTTNPFYQSPNIPYLSQKAYKYYKNSDLKGTEVLPESAYIFFPCDFEM